MEVNRAASEALLTGIRQAADNADLRARLSNPSTAVVEISDGPNLETQTPDRASRCAANGAPASRGRVDQLTMTCIPFWFFPSGILCVVKSGTSVLNASSLKFALHLTFRAGGFLLDRSGPQNYFKK